MAQNRDDKNKEVELFKLQVLSDFRSTSYFTWLTIFTGVFVSFWVYLLEKVPDPVTFYTALLIGGFLIFGATVQLVLKPFLRQTKRLSEYIEQVKTGAGLPSLIDLFEKRRKLLRWLKPSFAGVWLSDLRYRWKGYVIGIFLLTVFTFSLLSLIQSASFFGGFSVDLGTIVAAQLLTVLGILVGFAVLMQESRIRAGVVCIGVTGIMLTLTTVIDGYFLLRLPSGVPPPSISVLVFFGNGVSFTRLFEVSLGFFVVTLTGYIADVLTEFSSGPSEEEWNIPI